MYNFSICLIINQSQNAKRPYLQYDTPSTCLWTTLSVTTNSKKTIIFHHVQNNEQIFSSYTYLHALNWKLGLDIIFLSKTWIIHNFNVNDKILYKLFECELANKVPSVTDWRNLFVSKKTPFEKRNICFLGNEWIKIGKRVRT